MANWKVTYYDINGKMLGADKFYDRTEREAAKEAIGLMPHECEDWSLQEGK